MAAAKNRAFDERRRAKLIARKHEEIGRDMDERDDARSRCRARRRYRRRSPAPHLHRLPSGALDGSARRADLAADRRPHHGRDRARLSRRRADHRAADRAREAHAHRGEGAVRGAARRGARRAPRLGARGDLPHLQRRLCGDRRRGLDAARAVRGSAAPRAHPRRARAGGSRGARPRRADGDPGVAPEGAHRRAGRADPAARAEPRALGPVADPPRACGARARRGAGPARAVRAAEPRSPPAMRVRAPRTRPTGGASSRFTSSLPRSRRRR